MPCLGRQVAERAAVEFRGDERASPTPSSGAILVLISGLFQPSLASWKDVKEGTREPVTGTTIPLGHFLKEWGQSRSTPERNIG